MNGLISKVKELYHDYFSLVFLPEGGQPFFQLKLRRLYIWIFVLLLSGGLLYSLIMTNVTSTIHSSLTANINLNNRLKFSTNNQSNHIKELESDLTVIKEKIDYLTELEYNVRAMVGLSPAVTSEKVNRSADRTATDRNATSINSLQETSETQSETEETKVKMEIMALSDPAEINGQLSAKLENMNTLVSEVEERLRFLSCFPDRWPTRGNISSYFGYRTHPIYRTKDFHSGIDIANSYGTRIVASGSGKVVFSAYKTGYGYTIIIDHGYGYKTLYGHNSSLLVSTGDYVDKGDVIAKMGSTGTSTGNHCHFEVIKNGVQIDPYKHLNSN